MKTLGRADTSVFNAPYGRGTREKELETFAYHFVRRSRASRGAEYRERIRTSTETTDEDGFFNMNVFT